MLVSTRSFQPMLNGYSGFKPPSYYEHVKRSRASRTRRRSSYLQNLGVTVVLVDGRNMRPANLAALDAFPQLSLVKTDGVTRIYLLASKSNSQ